MFRFFRKASKTRLGFLVIGLGNPGEKYEGTRHNIGFDILVRFSKLNDFPKFKKLGNALVSEKVLPEGVVLLVLSQTYMNASGEVLGNLSGKYEFQREDLLVVHDDLDLALGELRYRGSGSSGGHNGLKSMESALGTKDYSRLKFGIGRGSETVLEYVLGRWRVEEKNEVEERVDTAAKCLLFWIQNKDKRELINSSFNRN